METRSIIKKYGIKPYPGDKVYVSLAGLNATEQDAVKNFINKNKSEILAELKKNANEELAEMKVKYATEISQEKLDKENGYCPKCNSYCYGDCK